MSEAVLEDVPTDVGYTTPVVNSSRVAELTAKEMMFCRFIIAGQSKATAYVSAGYSANSPESASSAGCQLAQRPRVAIYLKELREAAFTANVLSLAEKRDYLSRLVRTPISQIDATSDLAQGQKFDRETGVMTELKIPDKLKALELDAKLAGELKEQAVVNNSFNFAMLGDHADEQGDVVELPAKAIE